MIPATSRFSARLLVETYVNRRTAKRRVIQQELDSFYWQEAQKLAKQNPRKPVAIVRVQESTGKYSQARLLQGLFATDDLKYSPLPQRLPLEGMCYYQAGLPKMHVFKPQVCSGNQWQGIQQSDLLPSDTQVTSLSIHQALTQSQFLKQQLRQYHATLKNAPQSGQLVGLFLPTNANPTNGAYFSTNRELLSDLQQHSDTFVAAIKNKQRVFNPYSFMDKPGRVSGDFLTLKQTRKQIQKLMTSAQKTNRSLKNSNKLDIAV